MVLPQPPGATERCRDRDRIAFGIEKLPLERFELARALDEVGRRPGAIMGTRRAWFGPSSTRRNAPGRRSWPPLVEKPLP
jgi:hypothetical protein